MSEPIDRRAALALAAASTAALALAPRAAAGAPLPGPTPTDTGSVSGGGVQFPNWRETSDRADPPPPYPAPPSERVGFAIVGLGRLALQQILPAFAQCEHARPVALVSGTPDKLRAVATQHGISADHCLDYADMARLQGMADVRAVYVVTPNALHRRDVEAAAAAGKHVLCEKPMTTSPEDARAMIAACARANVHLMIAYRCQYEPYNREAIRRARSGELGPLKAIDAVNVQAQGTDAASLAQWRLKRALAGGGSLPDVGLYCLNSARAVTGEEPTSVFAHVYSTPGDPRFREVEESVAFQLVFPSGVVANCLTSYGAHESRRLALHFERGTIELPNAFAYDGQQMIVSRVDGKAEGREQVVLGPKNQFALEIDHFARCIAENRRPHTPGEEGLADHIAMAALYRSGHDRRPVALAASTERDATRGPAPAED